MNKYLEKLANEPAYKTTYVDHNYFEKNKAAGAFKNKKTGETTGYFSFKHHPNYTEVFRTK